ncbi:MAG: hypothetical protein HAW60_04880, partial [Bdellovibrionales bacterium]|nr:hypothetical protein [Bdellovibrionales bacterium]
NEKYQKKDTSLKQINLIKNNFNTLIKIKKDLKKLTFKQELLENILPILEKNRKEYIDNILSSIAEEAEELYLKIHPNEQLGNLLLSLSPNKQSSLNFTGKFQNTENIPPQAYYSDSHLDTLGVCIFLSLAKYFNNEIIVLDDVLTSVDQPHMSRFIDMLCEESKNFSQIFIATHYRPWKEQYKFHRKSSAHVQLLELAPWSIDNGIRIDKTKLSLEELIKLQNTTPFPRESIISKSGLMLESLLDHISLLYKLPMPRKPSPHYTLGELFNSFSSDFKKKLKVKKISADQEKEFELEKIINKLQDIAWIRNIIASHWNEDGMHYSDSDVLYFSKNVLEFAKLLICDNCKSLPTKKKNNEWVCYCETSKLISE